MLNDGECAAFSYDNSMIAISDKGTDVQVISSSSPYSQINTFQSDGDTGKFTLLEFNRDSSKLAMCSDDKKVKVYTISNGNNDLD